MIEDARLDISFNPEWREGESVFPVEQSATVRAAVERIPRPQRQAIVLGFFSGLTQLQIAEKIGEPLEIVKDRIRLGLLKLHESLNSSRSLPFEPRR